MREKDIVRFAGKCLNEFLGRVTEQILDAVGDSRLSAFLCSRVVRRQNIVNHARKLQRRYPSQGVYPPLEIALLNDAVLHSGDRRRPDVGFQSREASSQTPMISAPALSAASAKLAPSEMFPFRTEKVCRPSCA
jgi:hypothetical protein